MELISKLISSETLKGQVLSWIVHNKAEISLSKQNKNLFAHTSCMKGKHRTAYIMKLHSFRTDLNVYGTCVRIKREKGRVLECIKIHYLWHT